MWVSMALVAPAVGVVSRIGRDAIIRVAAVRVRCGLSFLRRIAWVAHAYTR